MGWIEQGFLKADRQQTRTGKPVYSIAFDALQRFCKERTGTFSLLAAGRLIECASRRNMCLPEACRIASNRESKRENDAYERGEYFEGEDYQRRA
jgi:hypothetical protein